VFVCVLFVLIVIPNCLRVIELRKEAEALASQVGGLFVRVSAKRGFNVVHTVRLAVLSILAFQQQQQQQQNLRASKKCVNEDSKEQHYFWSICLCVYLSSLLRLASN
jgi:hypothetical protein